MKLNRFNGKRIALVMEVQGRDIVLLGTMALHTDSKQGQMLQVTVDSSDDAAIGAPVFLISEERWRHHIGTGLAHDCEYQLDLSQTAVAAG